MNKLKINFADVGNNGIVEKFVLGILEQKWEVEVTDNPDYLFCGDFLTYEFLNFDCVKIFVGGENEYPNLNLYDYAIGNNRFECMGRYVRWPFYLWRDGTRKEFEMACKKHIDIKREGRKFCNFVVSNGINADPYREHLFEELNKYKRVDSGGKYRNNIGRNIVDKLEFMRAYKFSIACENSSQAGYITEKIVEAWAAGTVPIYWGGADVAEEFNDRAFINCMAYESIDAVIDRIRELDNDSEQYWKMVEEPIIKKGSNAEEFMDDTVLLNWLGHIFERPLDESRRIGRYARDFVWKSEMERLVKNDEYYRILVSLDNMRERGEGIKENRQIVKAGKIAVYGLGIVGKNLIDGLGKDFYGKIKFIIDRKYCGTQYRGIDVVKLMDISDTDIDLVIQTVKDGNKKIESLLTKKFSKAGIINVKDLVEM